MLHNQRRTGSHLRLVWWPVAFVAATNPPQSRTGGEKGPLAIVPARGSFFMRWPRSRSSPVTSHTTARYRLAPPRSLVVQVRHDEKESFVQERASCRAQLAVQGQNGDKDSSRGDRLETNRLPRA